MAADGARTWILTGSPGNNGATRDHGSGPVCKRHGYASALPGLPGQSFV